MVLQIVPLLLVYSVIVSDVWALYDGGRDDVADFYDQRRGRAISGFKLSDFTPEIDNVVNTEFDVTGFDLLFNTPPVKTTGVKTVHRDAHSHKNTNKPR